MLSDILEPILFLYLFLYLVYGVELLLFYGKCQNQDLKE